MCGIAGFNRAPGDVFDGQAVAFALLRDIVTRGSHATGAAWHDPKRDKVGVSKLPVDALKWIRERGYLIEPDVDNLILHTRFATQGSPKVRGNNHPITSGDIVGVHNGIVYNDAALFKIAERPRHAQVDSEAVMALIDAHGPGRLGSLSGDAALAWINRSEPTTLHLARVIGRPLEMAHTEGGSLIFASTQAAIRDAAKAGGFKIAKWYDVKEATYIRVVGGATVNVETIPNVAKSFRVSKWTDANTSSSGKGASSTTSTSNSSTSSRTYPSSLATSKAGKRARRNAAKIQRQEAGVADTVNAVVARNVIQQATTKSGLTPVQRRALSILGDRLLAVDDMDALDYMDLADMQADAEADAMEEMGWTPSMEALAREHVEQMDADAAVRAAHAGRTDPAGTNDTSKVLVKRVAK